MIGAAVVVTHVDLVSLIGQTAAVIGSLSVIVGALVALIRLVIVKPLERMVDERVSRVEKQIEDRLTPIEHELHPNGGGSMRDAVRRIEVKVEGVSLALTSYEAKTSTYIRAQATALAKAGVDSPRPDDFGIE